jgi:hypothetical protein
LSLEARVNLIEIGIADVKDTISYIIIQFVQLTGLIIFLASTSRFSFQNLIDN